MENLLKKEKEIVVPGELIVKSMEFLPGRNCFREDEGILAKRLGLVSLNGRVVSIVPLNASYFPREGDMVVGKIKSIQNNGWVVNIYGSQEAFLPLAGVKEYIDTRKTTLNRYYDIGDMIYARVNGVQGTSIYLSMQDMKARKFRGGRVIKINASKVPRLIGKQGSMISTIKEGTGCRINAGQNGLVWIDGEDTNKCVEIIRLIEQEAASRGLTEKISSTLGVKPPEKVEKKPEEEPSDKTEEPKEEKPAEEEKHEKE